MFRVCFGYVEVWETYCDAISTLVLTTLALAHHIAIIIEDSIAAVRDFLIDLSHITAADILLYS